MTTYQGVISLVQVDQAQPQELDKQEDWITKRDLPLLDIITQKKNASPFAYYGNLSKIPNTYLSLLRLGNKVSSSWRIGL